MKILGVHYILDLFDCDPKILDDLNFLKFELERAADIAGAHILNTSAHKFHPQGVSVLVMVSESHLSIHTFPEVETATADIYTCGDINTEAAVNYIIKQLRCKRPSVIKLNRGVMI